MVSTLGLWRLRRRVMYNTGMNRWVGIRIGVLMACMTASLGLSAQSQPHILVCPVDGDGDGTRNDTAMTLAVFDALGDTEQVVSFARLRLAMDAFGIVMGTRMSWATRIVLARQVRADVVVVTRLEDAQVWVTVCDLVRDVVSDWSFDLDPSDASFCLLGWRIAEILGIEPARNATPSNEFYRVFASTYSALPRDVARNVMQRLLEHHGTSHFLFSEFDRRFEPPGTQDMSMDDLIFWRDLYLRHGAARDALPFSTAVLGLTAAGDAYGIHALILFDMGSQDLACTYLKMALAYGATTPTLVDLGTSCGIDLTVDVGNRPRVADRPAGGAK